MKDFNPIPAHLWQIPPVGTIFELIVGNADDEDVSIFSRGICVHGDDIYVRRGWMPFPGPSTPMCAIPRTRLERFSLPRVTIGHRLSGDWMYRSWKSFAEKGELRKTRLEISHLYLPSPTMTVMEISALDGCVFRVDEFRWARRLRFERARVEAIDVFVEFRISKSSAKCAKPVPKVEMHSPFSISEVIEESWMLFSAEDMRRVRELLNELETSE